MDYYNTLDIAREATQEDIRSAYRRMAMKWHPDRHEGHAAKTVAEAQFKLIKQAYETLSDVGRRADYDSISNNPFASMFSNFGQPHSNDTREWERSRMEEMRRYQEMLPRGADINWIAKISLSEALQGCEVQHVRKQRVECEACEGYGWNEDTCSACDGLGSLRTGGRYRACQHCGGTRVTQWDCTECEGKGKKSVSISSRIRVPKGVVDGSEIVAKGLGKASREGGLPGDLHITIRLKAERGFKFAGCDIAGPLKVPFSTALLGGEIEVDLPTGRRICVQIPPRSNSGKKIILTGSGLLGRNGVRGDAALTVTIVLPKSKRKLTQIEEQTLRSLDD